MTNNKTRKVQKYRGHTTHGGGHRKKRRGAGSKGGKGNAGTGKRAGHKRRGVVLGGSGFKPRRTKVVQKAINLGANIVGGCCGSTPHHIRLLKNNIN